MSDESFWEAVEVYRGVASMDTWMIRPVEGVDWGNTGSFDRCGYFPREAVTLRHFQLMAVHRERALTRPHSQPAWYYGRR